MSTQVAVRVRFPSGFSELTYSAAAPHVGDKLRRGTDQWEVVAVETDKDGYTVVKLAPAHDEATPEAA